MEDNTQAVNVRCTDMTDTGTDLWYRFMIRVPDLENEIQLDLQREKVTDFRRPYPSNSYHTLAEDTQKAIKRAIREFIATTGG